MLLENESIYLINCDLKISAMYAYMFEKDEERKKTLETTVKTETLPNYLKNMETILVARGGKHFAGNDVIDSYFIFLFLIYIVLTCKNCGFSEQVRKILKVSWLDSRTLVERSGLARNSLWGWTVSLGDLPSQIGLSLSILIRIPIWNDEIHPIRI